MYGAPNIEYTGPVQQTLFKDPVAEEVKESISHVKTAVETTLGDLLQEAAKLLERDEATDEEKKRLSNRIKALTKSAAEVTEGVHNFEKGQKAEQGMIEAAEAGETNLDNWVRDAAAHFKNSQKNVLRGVEIANEADVIDHVINQWNKGHNYDSKKHNFMQAMGRIAVGLEFLVDRVRTFPDRLAEAIVGGMENKKEAAQEALNSWKISTKSFYQKTITEVDDVMKSTADQLGAVREVLGDRAEGAILGFGRGVQGNIFNPLANFIADRAIPAMKGAAERAKDALFDQARAFGNDYTQAVLRRREARMSETTSAPEPPKIDAPGI